MEPLLSAPFESLELPPLPSLGDAPFHLPSTLPKEPAQEDDTVLQQWLGNRVQDTANEREREQIIAAPAVKTRHAASASSHTRAPSPTSAQPSVKEEGRLHDRPSTSWEDWYYVQRTQTSGDPNSKDEVVPGTRRLLSDLDPCSSRDVEAQDLMEALVMQTEALFPPSSEGSESVSKYIVQRPAPSHPFDAVIDSIRSTISSGISSNHFQWDAKRAEYRWKGAIVQPQKAEMYLATVEALRKTKVKPGKGKERQLEAEEPEFPKFKEWIGRERVLGLTSGASDSSVNLLLGVGTLVRRLEERIESLRSQTARALVAESSALLHALQVVVEWVQLWLKQWHVEIKGREIGLAGLHGSIQEIHALLNALAAILACSESRRPPFGVPFRIDRTTSVLTHIFAHYTSASVSQTSIFVQRTLLWVLEKTSHSWRQDIASWIGWPGAPRRTANLEIGEDAPSFTANVGSSSSKKSKTKRVDALQQMEPWSGAQVEWGMDARGEEDVGYRLLPAKLPSFISIAKARSLLEAGRALRLLHKAADPDHPLLKALNETSAQDALPLPSWLDSDVVHSARQRQLVTRIREHQRAIAVWRRRSGRRSQEPSSELVAFPGPSDDHGLIAAPPTQGATFTANDLLARLDQSLVEDDRLSDPLVTSDLAEFSAWIEHVAPSPNPSESNPQADVDHSLKPSARPAQRLFERFLQWSKLINAALISVFFRDLGLPAYLSTCRQFLLLGSATFSDSLQELLFTDGVNEDGAPELLRTGQMPSAQPGEGLSRLLACERWPPPAGQISTRFNAAVVKAVADLREARGASSNSKQITATPSKNDSSGRSSYARDALKDLDERLSFALMDPSISKIRGHAHSQWETASSIDALDWLTLSFHPPALIAPLLTHHAQLGYQRILNFLLRLLRVKAVLRGLHLRIIKLRSLTRGPRRGPGGASNTGLHLDLSSIYAFHARAQHFLSALGSYVEQVAVQDIWERFEKRLDQLQRDVEAQDESFLQLDDEDDPHAAAGPAGGGTAGDVSDGGGGSVFGGRVMDGATEQGEQRSVSGTSAHSLASHLKDVFSIAQYHERVLDRIIIACFQKQRLSTISGTMNELFDLILSFSSIVRQLEELGDQYQEEEEQDEEQIAKLLARLHKQGARFESRFSLLVRGLRIIEQSGRRTASSTWQDTASGGGRSRRDTVEKRNSIKRDSRQQDSLLAGGALEEAERQEEEAEEDLKLLEMESTARKSASESELAGQLLTRLDLMRKYYA